MPKLYQQFTLSGLHGNEAAHAAARTILHRAFPTEVDGTPPISSASHSVEKTYTDILYHYRQERLIYPPPHPSLNIHDSRIWRRIQTQTYYNMTVLHHISPTIYPSNCATCNTPNTTYRLVWECVKHPNPLPSPTLEQWEHRLTSSKLEDQEYLISRARAAVGPEGGLD